MVPNSCERSNLHDQKYGDGHFNTCRQKRGICMLNYLDGYSPVENKNDLELDFKVFFFTDSCCSDIVDDESK